MLKATVARCDECHWEGVAVDSEPREQAAHLGHIQHARFVPNGHVAPGCICNLPLHRKWISGAVCSLVLISRLRVDFRDNCFSPQSSLEKSDYFFNTCPALNFEVLQKVFRFNCRFTMCLSPLSWCRTVAWRGQNPGLRVTVLFRKSYWLALRIGFFDLACQSCI